MYPLKSRNDPWGYIYPSLETPALEDAETVATEPINLLASRGFNL